jgi:hypothetical protein
MMILLQLFAPHVQIFTEHGIIAPFQKLMEILVPFYIVALAAVATFAGGSLAQPMKGEKAILRTRKSNGQYFDRELTRQQFVCYLFGYLSTLALFVYVLAILCGLIADDAGTFLASKLGTRILYARQFVLFVFLLPIWQIIVATLLGIYFMSDRLQVMDHPDI